MNTSHVFMSELTLLLTGLIFVGLVAGEVLARIITARSKVPPRLDRLRK